MIGLVRCGFCLVDCSVCVELGLFALWVDAVFGCFDGLLFVMFCGFRLRDYFNCFL